MMKGWRAEELRRAIFKNEKNGSDAEIVTSRVSSHKKNLGLTNWKGEIITREQAEVAKNYLEELELKRLNLLVEQFLSFAELQSVEQRVMYMKDWIQKLDSF